jgi:type IV secretion system protein TrbB
MNNSKTISRHLEMLTSAFGQDINTFMLDRDITEIMLNPDGTLWVESYTKGQFLTNNTIPASQALNIIKLVAAFHQTIADAAHPEVACELPETYARFQGWLPPIVTAPTFTIRKRATSIYTLDDYIASKSLTTKHADFLRTAVMKRKNILISGGTTAGKTTFANALLHELRDSSDRIIILEDLPELQIAVANYVKLTTSANVPMRSLVKGVLRMRPDRLIIGEVRDGAALDLLKAWNTGHPGGICTIHANSPEATLARIEDLVQEVVTIVPKNLISEAIDIIVFMQRDADNKYKVASIHNYKKHEDKAFLEVVGA